FASNALNTGSNSTTELLMTFRTSVVAVCCSRAAFSSRLRVATCFWRSAVDAPLFRAFRALGAPRAAARRLPMSPLCAVRGGPILWKFRRPRHVRFGSKADMCGATANVRFTPESDIKCDIIECPLRANCGHRASSLNNFVGHRQHILRDCESKCLGCFQIDDQHEPC